MYQAIGFFVVVSGAAVFFAGEGSFSKRIGPTTLLMLFEVALFLLARGLANGLLE
jgi:hypothetical protein